MDSPDIYTITIVRNIGIPISFTVKRWKIFFFFTVFLVATILIGFQIFQHLQIKTTSEDLLRKLAEAEKTVSVLSDQIARRDNAKYHEEGHSAAKSGEHLKHKLVKQPDLDVEPAGGWITDQNAYTYMDLQEEAHLEISSLTTKIEGDDLFVKVKLQNNSKTPVAVGGYLFVSLINNDRNPPVYRSATEGLLGENGFPYNYKSGKQYYLGKNRTSRTYTLNKIPLTEVNEYYTDALLLLYSYKGRLISKQTLQLDKKIFLE